MRRIRIVLMAAVVTSFSANGAAADICVLPPADLTYWWSGDADATDIQSGLNGALKNGASITAGYVRQGFGLDGIDDYVGTPPLGVTSGTVEFWMYPRRVGGDTRVFSGISQNTTGSGMPGFVFNSGLVSVWTGNATGWQGLSANNAVPANQWTHLAFVYTNGTAILYVNGISTGFKANTGFTFNDEPLGIGAKGNLSHGRSFDGVIDEFSIFRRALTATEVASIHSAGSAGKCRVPVADAGADQTVDEGQRVWLDATDSRSYPGADLTSYNWHQVSGPDVSMDLSDPVRPSFVAPSVPVGGATLTFQLTVSNHDTASSADIVNVTVVNVNHAPIAVAQVSAEIVSEGALVSLDGAQSFDEDGEDVTYRWEQIEGIPVDLGSTDKPQVAFIAPMVGVAGSGLTFRLTVGDGLAETTDDVMVAVVNVNQAPNADAGQDQTVQEGSTVKLDGGLSQDPDGDALTYQWTQIAGTAVNLTNSDRVSPTFVAPAVDAGGMTLTFHLAVIDPYGGRGKGDRVDVHVQNVNDPPSCINARPSVSMFWPPNHKMVGVQIVGVSDPNDNTISIEIERVTQDEPVAGLGDGDTGPDAVLQGAVALLRAERDARGNGRAYRVSYRANDDQGGSCGGTVMVVVPHSIKAPTVVEDPAVFESTEQ